MNRQQLYKYRQKFWDKWNYNFIFWDRFNYDYLSNIMYIKRAGRNDNDTYNDCIIMFDTETSKKDPAVVGENHVVAFTVSIRAFDKNIVTLWGRRPDDLVNCLIQIHEAMAGQHTIFYCHNYAYDYVFIRKFLLQELGTPEKALNVKPHYPILMTFKNGMIIKDSLILAQKSLERWANDLDVEHKKAVGSWDYNKIRSQKTRLSAPERHYIENDTLAGVECIQKTMDSLSKRIYSIPYTATGIVREGFLQSGKAYHAHEAFKKMSPEFEVYQILEKVFHGGFTHANRYMTDRTIKGLIRAYDFTSSYPYVMLSEKFPMEKFQRWHDCSASDIIESSENYAFIFKLILYNFEVRDMQQPMPMLQFYKMENPINCIIDNGRVLQGAYTEIYMTEQDLHIFLQQYTAERHACVEVYYSRKEYLPRWFTDYVYQLFKDKTMLKGLDPVDYMLAKGRLNSTYGCCVQKAIQENIVEDYQTGMYEVKNLDQKTGKELTHEELYDKYLNNHNKVLPYQWGVYVTAYAFRNLFTLGACAGVWIYSDTDSCYGMDWDLQKVKDYNQKCREKLHANGYEPIIWKDKEYCLGVATLDGEYLEFRTVGAKRYCGRSKEDGKLHSTVAGVPKRGAECLQDNIDNFTRGFIFPGSKTGKQTHTYFYVEESYEDEKGNLTGDSIDLSPCDYLLDVINIEDWEKMFEEEIEVQTYEEQ